MFLRLQRNFVKLTHLKLLAILCLFGLFVILSVPVLRNKNVNQLWISVQQLPSFEDYTLYEKSAFIAHTHIPRKIWQMCWTGPFNLATREVERAKTWTQKNQDYRYELITNTNALSYVTTHFGPTGLNRPDIVDTYQSLKIDIIKADILRYLVMYIDGGFYADIDAEALHPIDTVVLEEYKQTNIDMVIGIEVDEPSFGNHTILGPVCTLFCQFAFLSKPKQKFWLQLVNNILLWIKQLERQQAKPMSELTLSFDDVMTGTGPAAFTNAMLNDMSERVGKIISWSYFHNMTEPKVIDKILVLPVQAFSADSGHSNSATGTHFAGRALLKHHFHASQWTTSHRRFEHPLVGQVHGCNWNRTCVDEWDARREKFDKMSPDAQTEYWKKWKADKTSEAMRNAGPGMRFNMKLPNSIKRGKVLHGDN